MKLFLQLRETRLVQSQGGAEGGLFLTDRKNWESFRLISCSIRANGKNVMTSI